MNRRFLIPLVVLVFCAIGAAAMFAITPNGNSMAGSFIGGPFKMVSQDDKPISDADLRGHPFLVFFGYTHCPDTCPTTLLQVSQMLKALGDDKNVKVLFVTVDPERDTPQIMKEYLSSFDPRILGLSGSPQETATIEKAYRVYAKKVPGKGADYSMDHTAIIYLMDKQGRFVNAFNVDRPPQAAAQELATYL